MGWQLFPTGIGWRDFSVTQSEGTFSCPNNECRGQSAGIQQYRLRRARNWFTVLFIPLIPLNEIGVYVECRHCKSVFNVGVLSTSTSVSTASPPPAVNSPDGDERENEAPSTTRADALAISESAAHIGWHSDPFGRHRYRYWNGTVWTEQAADAGVITSDPPGFPVPASASPAWVPDPSGRHRYRYWDGANWTDHVADAGSSSVDPVAPPPEHANPTGVEHGESNEVAGERAPGTAPIGAGNPTARDRLPCVILDDGSRLDLSRPIVFGRDPVALAGFGDAVLLTVDDPTVSKTHAIIGCDGDEVWAVDLQSRNGIALESRPADPLAPGERHRVQVGDAVLLGESSTVRVLSASDGLPEGTGATQAGARPPLDRADEALHSTLWARDSTTSPEGAPQTGDEA